ncbi:hypothetical protein Barb6_01100 [Bacteroidales bacterium Barb6]|nr:hypothetical protein Barb6_01100 [Bacteroidales bacterium Barb6]
MKRYLYSMLLLSCVFALSSCSDDDDNAPGNPAIEAKTTFGSAHFGDSLQFTIHVSDNDVPLSTLKAQLFFDEEKVSETIIRTKTDGEYSGKIHVPYYKDIPNGTATLKLLLQNIHLTITEQVFDLPVSRPDYPSLTLVAEDKEYTMRHTGQYQYAATENFPMKVKGYIKAKAMDGSGNDITFGWEDGKITHGSTADIPFSNNARGEYSITFNTRTYEASPFLIAYAVNGSTMTMVDDTNYKTDLDITRGQEITIDGFENLESWWIDPDFFVKGADGRLTFNPASGKYRVTADFKLEYFRVEVLSGNDVASLQEDGSGAVWIIGEGVGKPSLDNMTGWDTGKALCLAPIGNKKYQISFIAGKTIRANDINFKFFHQKGWGGEFIDETISTASDIIFIGTGGDSGRDPGNLGLVKDKTLTEGKTYVFTVDLSAGNNDAILTVIEK